MAAINSVVFHLIVVEFKRPRNSLMHIINYTHECVFINIFPVNGAKILKRLLTYFTIVSESRFVTLWFRKCIVFKCFVISANSNDAFYSCVFIVWFQIYNTQQSSIDLEKYGVCTEYAYVYHVCVYQYVYMCYLNNTLKFN